MNAREYKATARSFSFARAIRQPVLEMWRGEAAHSTVRATPESGSRYPLVRVS